LLLDYLLDRQSSLIKWPLNFTSRELYTNRHQLGKLAMLYLGGVWTEDLSKQQAKQQQEHGELDRQRSPIVADPNGSP